MTQRTYQRIAHVYDVLDLPFEYVRYRPLRRRLFEGVTGLVLDAGSGTGRNMSFYPPHAKVIGIDLSPAMLDQAKKRRDRLGLDTPLAAMDIRRTAFPDRTFDAVVASFLFCVLENEQQLPALLEIKRICKPGATVRLLEYVYSEKPGRRFVMRLWAPWVKWAYDAGFDRATTRFVREAGFAIVAEPFLFADIIKLIVARA